jgi:hypothetical protein
MPADDIRNYRPYNEYPFPRRDIRTVIERHWSEQHGQEVKCSENGYYDYDPISGKVLVKRGFTNNMYGGLDWISCVECGKTLDSLGGH